MSKIGLHFAASLVGFWRLFLSSQELFYFLQVVGQRTKTLWIVVNCILSVYQLSCSIMYFYYRFKSYSFLHSCVRQYFVLQSAINMGHKHMRQTGKWTVLAQLLIVDGIQFFQTVSAQVSVHWAQLRYSLLSSTMRALIRIYRRFGETQMDRRTEKDKKQALGRADVHCACFLKAQLCQYTSILTCNSLSSAALTQQ